MADSNIEIGDIHWLMAILQNIDVGLVVLDRNYNIQLWNGFMESHSGLSPQVVSGQNLFDQFHEIPRDWFMKKAEPVFQLKTRTFTIWEQRPYLFRFKNYRPITGRASVMYQNTSIIPLESIDRSVNHICLIIYDVTDIAVSRADVETAQQSLSERNRTDILTGLNNRSYWQEEADIIYRQCQNTGVSSTLLMLEIDDFRNLQRSRGHRTADEVIRSLSHCLMETVQQEDLLCRYDGEVFALMLNGVNSDDARIYADHICKRASEVCFEPIGEGITLSIGMATFSTSYNGVDDWLQAADKAMYHARESGGNRVSVFASGSK
ncbi:sensor domain-containing diguanylate cyclase [Thalassolituus marinus]|uniref:diguanylate cyclase n=1 Tax=Thalassolituus marinus TaxID=671053 RepID=A0ABS7ZRW5_9GAMM|nr:diguanylate cyclase [Thalassolituus marinus]MCA6063155.1 diguanylate cyclase [Thalassolituus marinus]